MSKDKQRVEDLKTRFQTLSQDYDSVVMRYNQASMDCLRIYRDANKRDQRILMISLLQIAKENRKKSTACNKNARPKSFAAIKKNRHMVFI